MPRLVRATSTPCRAVARVLSLLALLPLLPAQDGWVAESPHFRVLVQPSPDMDARAAAISATDLEATRLAFKQAGLGLPRREDGRLEVLVVPQRLDLHALIGDPPGSRTRGITIRGLDRDYVAIPWHEPPGPRVILAHEYAHQLDDAGWPPWFSEGRAVYLARRTEPRTDADPLAGLVAMLGRSAWIPWNDLISADRDSPVTDAELFQAQSWLLVHWLASNRPDLTQLSPNDAEAMRSEIGPAGLDATLRLHLAGIRDLRTDWLVPLETPPSFTEARPAESWEIPLFEAEARLALRMLDESESSLSSLAGTFPAQARVRAAVAALDLVRGRQDRAEQGFGSALRLGDARARTAYRYAVLLMRPGSAPHDRAEEALRHALRARGQMPGMPAHHLAVVHARMLAEDWNGAFSDLRELLRFPDWAARAAREAREIQRRIVQAVGTAPRPLVATSIPPTSVPVPDAPPLEPWEEADDGGRRAAKRSRWPPYGTWLVHGRISWVECDELGKRVIVVSPYQRLVLRENPDRPPRLINRPFRGHTLPCHKRGWQVAIAYRKLDDPGEVRGEIVGIRF